MVSMMDRNRAAEEGQREEDFRKDMEVIFGKDGAQKWLFGFFRDVYEMAYIRGEIAAGERHLRIVEGKVN